MGQIIQYYGSEYFVGGEQFCIVKFEEYAEKDMEFHYHDFVEICYVYQGFGHHCLKDKKYKVSKGDLFIINYDMSHSFCCSPESEKLITFNLLLAPKFLDNLLLRLEDFDSSSMSYAINGLWSEDDSDECLKLTIAEQFDMDSLFDRMYVEYTQRKAGYVNIISAGVMEMITKIMRYYSSHGQSDVVVQKKAFVIDSIKNYLQVNYSSGFNLEELACQSFFSKNYLCKIFKKITGQTISEYMFQLRIEEACKLLKNPDLRILEIALDVGFSDYKSFNNVFKKFMNMPAGEYRKNVLEQDDSLV